MIYTIKLENLNTGDIAYIHARSNEKAEVLCPKIKVALRLPYTDHGWHRFISHGITYVIEQHAWLEPEIRAEYDLRSGPYRSSERTTVERIFTSVGSSILYTQDGTWAHEQKVRCTFVRRTFLLLPLNRRPRHRSTDIGDIGSPTSGTSVHRCGACRFTDVGHVGSPTWGMSV